MKKEKTEDASGTKVPRSAVRKAYWYYQFFRGGNGYTYNMASNLAACMGFILRPLYKSKEKIGEEMKKYYFYFDTNVPFVGAVAGLLIGMEEKRAESPEKVPANSIPALATGLMGSVGNIGDIVQQGIIDPLILTLGISLCGSQLNPSPLGAIVSMLAVALVTVGMSYFIWMKSYDLGDELLSKILAKGLMDKIIKASCILGCVAMGGLMAKYVTVTTSLAWFTDTSSFIVQTDLLDAIMPKLLPLAVTMGLLKVFKKGISPAKVVWITMGASLLLAVLGILGPVPSVPA